MLVAISIPIFTSQLEKAREATDMANIRSAYAEVSADGLTDPDKDHTASVTITQKKEGWLTNNDTKIAGVKLSDIPSTGTVTVKYTAETGKVTINNNEAGSGYTTENSGNANQNNG